MGSLCTAMKSNPWSPQLEKASIQRQRPSAVKNKIKKEKKDVFFFNGEEG